MRKDQAYDLKSFLAISGLTLLFFLLIMAEIFALDSYKPSRLLAIANQTQSTATMASQSDQKLHKVSPLKIRVYLTTHSLMVGSCTATVPVDRVIYPSLNPIRDRLVTLFEGPTEFEQSVGYTSSLTGWQQVFMGTILQADGTLLVQFSEEVLDPTSSFYLGRFDNECGRGVWEAVYLTAKEDRRVKYVVFTINNNPQSWNNLVRKYHCEAIKNAPKDSEKVMQAAKQCQSSVQPEQSTNT